MPSVNANANAQSKLWGYMTGNDCGGGGSRGGLFHEDIRFMNLIFCGLFTMGYERLRRGEGTHSFFVYELRM